MKFNKGFKIYLGTLGATLFLLGGLFIQKGGLDNEPLKNPDNEQVTSVIRESWEKEFSDKTILDIVADKEKLKEFITYIGPERVMEKLLSDSGQGSAYDCHQQAHDIGRLSYGIYKASAFGKGNSSCHSGYYHGAMESLLVEEGTVNIAQTVERICEEFETSFGEFECLHGVGHGVLAYESYDLPASIEVCGDLSTSFSQRSCYGGLFMENIITGLGFGARDVHETTWLNDDPLFPCNSISQDPGVQSECWMMQTSWMLKLNNYDFKKVAGLCSSVPGNYRVACFQSLGRDAAGHTLRDSAEIVRLCANAPQENTYYIACIKGGVNVVIDFWGEGLDNQASEVCKLVSEDNKLPCYSLIAGRLQQIFIDKARIKEICGTFEPEYQKLCR